MNQLELMNNYSKKFNNFNHELKDIRNHDDMIAHIDEFFSEIPNKYLPNNIKYNGYSIVENIGNINELNVTNDNKKINKNKKKIIEIDSKETFSKLYIFKFDLKHIKKLENNQEKEEKSKVEIPLWVPILDGYSYLIKGSKYIAPLQIIDSLFFSKKNILILKTMNRVIKMSRSSKIIVDINKQKYYTDCFYLHIAGKRSSFLLYYWAYFGFYTTAKYFGADKYLELVKLNQQEINHPEILPQDKLYFKFGTLYLEVDKEAFYKNEKLKQYVACTLALSKRNIDEDAISKTSKWQTKVSNTVSETQALIKGRQILRTFVLSLDSRTKRIISKFVEDGEYRQDIWSLIKWSFLKFDLLTNRPINDLNNKRIRYSEYIISPLIETVTKKIERYLNTADKHKDLKRIEDIFKIPRTIVIYSINSSMRGSNLNIVQYSDRSNDNSYPFICKVTFKGKGTPQSRGKKYISFKYKAVDVTHIGNIGISSSYGEIGLDFCLCPTTEIDFDKMTFKSQNKKIGCV